MGFRAYLIENMQVLVEVYYHLHSNGTNYLKSLQINWTFLELNLDEVYDKTISVLQLILLMLFSQKLANLPHL